MESQFFYIKPVSLDELKVQRLLFSIDELKISRKSLALPKDKLKEVSVYLYRRPEGSWCLSLSLSHSH